MKTLQEVTEYMISPGDEKKPWLVTAMISHCARLAFIHNISKDRSKVAEAVAARLAYLSQN